jgi:hypothetical protein
MRLKAQSFISNVTEAAAKSSPALRKTGVWKRTVVFEIKMPMPLLFSLKKIGQLKLIFSTENGSCVALNEPYNPIGEIFWAFP